MNKTEKLTPKVYVFDINPGNDEATKDLVIGRLGTISKIISSHHYFVLLSHSSLRVLKKITHDAKITKGYIVSDSGARIYDIGRKKIIYEKPIDKTSCLNIIHSIAMLNMLCLASSSLTEFSYSFDPLSSTSLNRLHYIPLNVINSYPKYKEQVSKNKIYSFLCYQKSSLEFAKKYSQFTAVADDFQIHVHKIADSCFFITNNQTSKYKSVLKIMELNKVHNFQDIYYFAINSFNAECYTNFKNRIVSASAYYETRSLYSNIYTVTDEALINEIIMCYNDTTTANSKNKINFTPSKMFNRNEKIFPLEILKNEK